MNRNTVMAIIGVVIVVLVGIALSRYFKEKVLPTGGMSETTPTPSVTTTSGTISGRPQVTIKTEKGDIVLELRPDVAPKTVANFLGKWSQGFCIGKTFHRVENWVVQGCDPKGDGTGGNTTLPTEISSESFTAGSLGVARLASNKNVSNDSQFFITKTDSTFLNGEYTYFGKVISGMDVVAKLMVGDKITESVVVTK